MQDVIFFSLKSIFSFEKASLCKKVQAKIMFIKTMFSPFEYFIRENSLFKLVFLKYFYNTTSYNLNIKLAKIKIQG